MTVNEKGTIVISATFKDEDGAGVTPTSVTWSLLDADGAIVNSREDVSETPGETVYIVCSGDDLSMADGQVRTALVKWAYNSSYGTGLPGRDVYMFEIQDLLGVA